MALPYPAPSHPVHLAVTMPFNATSFPAARFGPSGQRRSKHGRLRPPQRKCELTTTPLRLGSIPVTVPSRLGTGGGRRRRAASRCPTLHRPKPSTFA